MVYEDFDIVEFINKYPVVNGLTTEYRERADGNVEFKLYVDNNTRSVRKRLPNRVYDIPINYEERKASRSLEECSERHDQQIVQGGLACSEQENDNYVTTTVVGYDDWDRKIVITAYHVTDGAEIFYQPEYDESDSRVVSFSTTQEDTGHDTVAYHLEDSVDSFAGGVYGDSVYDIVGAWTFSGIESEHQNGRDIFCEFSGARNCYNWNTTYSTEKNDLVIDQVNMENEKNDPGDSGGPWVDDNAYLVMMHNGENWVDGSYRDAGTAGQSALDAVDARIFK